MSVKTYKIYVVELIKHVLSVVNGESTGYCDRFVSPFRIQPNMTIVTAAGCGVE